MDIVTFSNPQQVCCARLQEDMMGKRENCQVTQLIVVQKDKTDEKAFEKF